MPSLRLAGRRIAFARAGRLSGAVAIMALCLMPAACPILPEDASSGEALCSIDGDCARLGASFYCNRDSLTCALNHEVCDDYIDNDGDGRVDCDDAECEAFCAARAEACASPSPAEGIVTGNTASGHERVHRDWCFPATGPQRIYVFAPAEPHGPGDVTVTLETATEQGFYAFTYDCIHPATWPSCTPPKAGVSTATFGTQTGFTPVYVAVVAERPDQAGPFTLSFEFTPDVCGDGKRTQNEPCDDGNQVSGDGCSAGCALEPSFFCDHAEPLADGLTEGELGDGPSVFYGTCGGFGGAERVFVYTPIADGTLYLTLESATALVVHARGSCPDPSAELSCVGVEANTLEVVTLEAKAGAPLYVFVDGASAAGGDTHFTLLANFSAP